MNKVDEFMARLSEQQAPMMKRAQKSNEKKLEKVALNFPGNFGRYQILPVDNVVTDYPYVTLFNTLEICIPRNYKNADGTEKVIPTWVKIIPKEGFIMKDQTGRVVSSLTNEDEQLLYQTRMVWEELYKELDAKNNQDICRDLIRRRNYTIFNGYCAQRWSEGNTGRNPDRVKFGALFISTAKGFITQVDSDINDKKFEKGDDISWIESIYNRSLADRGGCIMMTIGKAAAGAGFDVKVNHFIGANGVKDIVIPEEDMELMQDPLETFLGWQAKREDDSVDPRNRRLFNASLMKEAMEFMSHKLAAIRTAKAASNGMDIKAAIAQAIQMTNDSAVSAGVVSNTNDPMLQTQNTPSSQPNVANIQNNNTAPFQSAPVFQASPVTGAPVGNPGVQQSAPFNAPSFASFGGDTAAANGNNSFPF